MVVAYSANGRHNADATATIRIYRPNLNLVPNISKEKLSEVSMQELKLNFICAARYTLHVHVTEH
jgi:hypothetical protein